MKGSYLLALVIALAAAGWLGSAYLGDTPPDAAENGIVASRNATVSEKPLMRVEVRYSVAATRVISLTLAGQTEPSRFATAKAETAGRVVAVEAEEGSAVIKAIYMELRTAPRYLISVSKGWKSKVSST